jgi:WD40 repeat protein
MRLDNTADSNTVAGPASAPAADHAFDVFLSYRRLDARHVALWLRDQLQRYRLPNEVLVRLSDESQRLHHRRPKVFVDTAYESTSADFLASKIYPALDGARRLIVVSSPAAFQPARDASGAETPNWLCLEIERFLRGEHPTARSRPIDVVLAPGARTDVFLGPLNGNPRWDWVDLRKFNRWRSIAHSEALEAALVKLAAGLYEVPADLLPLLMREAQRRRNRILRNAAIAGVLVAAVMAVLTTYAFLEQRKAEGRLDEALRAQSRVLSSEALVQSSLGDSTTGMLLALRALPGDMARPERPYVAEAEAALYATYRDAWERFRFDGFFPDARLPIFSVDGQWLLVAGGKRLHVYSLALPGTVRTFEGHDAQIIGAAFIDKSAVLTTADDGRLVVFDLFSGRAKARLETGNAGYVEAVVSGDGTIMGMYTVEGRIQTCRIRKEPMCALLDTGVGSLASIGLSRNGRHLIAAGTEGRTEYWDLVSHQLKARRHFAAKVESVALAPDGRLAIVWLANQSLALWDVASGKIRNLPSTHTGEPWRIRFNETGDRFASMTLAGEVRLWTSDGALLVLLPHSEWVVDARFSPDGMRLATASTDKTVTLWNVSDGSLLGSLVGHRQAVVGVAFSPDGKMVATSSRDGTARLWNAQAALRTMTLRPESGDLIALDVSGDGRRMVLVPGYGAPSLWDVERSTKVSSFEGDPRGATKARFSPNGDLVVTAWFDGSVSIWSARDGAPRQVLKRHNRAVTDFAFLDNGRMLLTAGSDGWIRTWDVATGQLRDAWEAHCSGVKSVDVSHDGALLISGCNNDVAAVWSLSAPKKRCVFQGEEAASIEKVGITEEGRGAFTINLMGQVALWDTNTGQRLARLESHGNDAMFTRDGKLLFVATTTGGPACSMPKPARCCDDSWAMVTCFKMRSPANIGHVRFCMHSSRGMGDAWSPRPTTAPRGYGTLRPAWGW